MAVNFIKSKIDYLVNKYPNIKVTLEVDSFSESYYLQVLPAHFFITDKNFLEDETNILLEFINLFPYQSITFCTEGDFYEIQNEDYISIGKDYV
jgi:hypothetical protein